MAHKQTSIVADSRPCTDRTTVSNSATTNENILVPTEDEDSDISSCLNPTKEGSDSEYEVEKVPECAVCLQTCIHPVQLPCNHIFCFLCVKGVANQSKRCALCRQEIPMDFLDHPALLRRKDLTKDTGFEDGFQWYYEGRNGWWQYDERTSDELEDCLKRQVKAFEILIAGFLYIIDLEAMVQIRRNDPTRRRRIKRDLSTIPKKGVAGLKTGESEVPGDGDADSVRVSGEGGEPGYDGPADGSTQPPSQPVTGIINTVTATHADSQNEEHLSIPTGNPSALDQTTLLNTMSNVSVSLPTGEGYGGSPHRSPNRTNFRCTQDNSQTPLSPNVTQDQDNSSEVGTSDSVTEEMNRNMEQLTLTPSGRYRHRHRHGLRHHRNNRNNHNYDEYGRPRMHLLETSSSSSDSDWDYWY